jgi:dihydrofolate synthase/folylpolyglutamate synthase
MSLVWLQSLEKWGIRPGLGRIRALLRALGNPEKRVPAVIVAGTNGKGSTSSTLASIFAASGYRTGLYTSPHLVDVRERWGIDGTMIDDDAFARAAAELQRASERTSVEPSYFEALTIIAFIVFAEAECDVSVLEVGMGGRLDATNVVRPLAALITPVGFDHTEFLGTTLRKIANEKAGVIHRNAIVLTSNDDPVVLRIIEKRAATFGNRFIIVDGEHDTPLRGTFQRRNTALAVRAAEELAPRFPKITRESIARGVKQTRWRGRLERIIHGNQEVWIDGCHNAHAAAPIAAFIEHELPRPRTLVFGIMADKDVGEVARMLFPLFEQIIATEPQPPRNASAESLAQLAHGNAVIEIDPRKAIERALAGSNRTIFIGGSLFLAAVAIAYFDERGKQHDD